MAETSAARTQPEYVETLKRERDRFVALAFCAADVLFEVDGKRVITYAAGATKALTGYEPEDVIGHSFVDLINDADKPVIRKRLASLGAANRLEPLVIRLAGAGGPTPPLMVTGYHLPDLPGSYFFALRLTSAHERGLTPADTEHDSETGLLTKEAFAEIAARRIQEAGPEDDELKLTMIRVNDMGALRLRLDEEADRNLMKTLGGCIGGRGEDAAARFDDENYGVLHNTGFDIAAVRLNIEAHLKAADPDGVGVEVRSDTVAAEMAGADPDDAARALLYTINQFCEASGDSPKIQNLSKNLDMLVADVSKKMTFFREMVSADNFDAVFQPIVDLESRKIHHYEALARFGGGLERSPYELITFAENMGLICDFDYAMFRKILDYLQAWRRQKKARVIAVNLSGRSLANEVFLQALEKLLAGYPDLRPQIVIEVTESAKIRDLEKANGIIQSLRTAGHHVCLDDFGAGAAALKYLHALDIDVVKIDGQYIQNAHTDRKLRAFLKAIGGLCGELGIDTIAEMVEEEATVTLLKDCGVVYGQGYLFGKPGPSIEAFEKPAKAAPTPKRGGWSKIARGG